MKKLVPIQQTLRFNYQAKVMSKKKFIAIQIYVITKVIKTIYFNA